VCEELGVGACNRKVIRLDGDGREQILNEPSSRGAALPACEPLADE